MRKGIRIFAAGMLAAVALTGCGSTAAGKNDNDIAADTDTAGTDKEGSSTAAGRRDLAGKENTSGSAEQKVGTVGADIIAAAGGSVNASIEIPDEIEAIPEKYFDSSDAPGTLEQLDYDTWESFSYDDKSTPLSKHAIVYLPYGYDEDQQYDIFYLMHGGWSDYTTLLGTPKEPSEFKNVLDNAIEAGDMEPMIIVCPTYNNTNENGLDSNSFSLAMQLTRQFHNELLNDLMPAVESKYSTYAADTTPEAFAASRDHRGFSGFSMGSVTTWRTFQYDLDYFHYFLPMSCGTSLDDDKIWQAAAGRDPEDYFVFVMTGTDDFAYSYDQRRTEAMAASSYFDDEAPEDGGNMAFRVKEGYAHDGKATMEYTFNGLKAFFGKGKTEQPAAAGRTAGSAKGTSARSTSAGNGRSGSGAAGTQNAAAASTTGETSVQEVYSRDSKVTDVMNDPVFDGHGRLLFPVDSGYWSGDTLGKLNLVWYNNIDPDTTVDIVNTLHDRAAAGETVFYDIYSDEEKKADPDKEDTGLFFFRGNKGAKTAIVNAGGGFAYVGAMQDSFPVSLALSRMGYNAFALIYRPGAETACEDLSRAVAFLEEHADELGIDMTDYSLWGGSAGARMADWVGTYGTAEFGEKSYPKPAAIVMQYTGLSEVTGDEPPTYACVGTSDGIASYRTMQARIDAIKANGTNAEIDVFPGLRHGFGLGTGTVAEGWINHAVSFWEENCG